MNRRAFLAGLAALGATGVTAAGLAARRQRTAILRVGVMTNLTHAPLLAGLGSGRIAQALAPFKVEARAFRAGPRVCEALIGDAIDAGTAGPAPVVVFHARHARSGGLRVLTGCASSGASFVVAKNAGIRQPADLHGKRLATTSIGTTQDVALRVYLSTHGLRERAAGGDVEVLAIAASTILEQMRRGDLHGAWLAEPWATRVVGELGAERLIDERDLWEGGRFATAVLATRAARVNDEAVLRLTKALEAEVSRGLREPKAMLDEAYAELKRHVGNPGARAIFETASRYVDFTSDRLEASMRRFGEHATMLGLCPPRPTEGLFPA